MAVAQVAKNHGDEWAWTHSQNSVPASASTPSLKISSKTIPINLKIVISCAKKRGIPFWVWRKSMETETTWSEFLNGRNSTVEQTPVSEEKNNPKDQDCQSQSQESKQES